MKLSVQLFSISVLCIIGWVPYGIVSTMQIFQNTSLLNYILSTFLIYFPYAQTLFLPYACLFFMPDIKRKFCDVLSWGWFVRICTNQNRLHPGNDVRLDVFSQATLRTQHTTVTRKRY